SISDRDFRRDGTARSIPSQNVYACAILEPGTEPGVVMLDRIQIGAEFAACPSRYYRRARPRRHDVRVCPRIRQMDSPPHNVVVRVGVRRLKVPFLPRNDEYDQEAPGFE